MISVFILDFFDKDYNHIGVEMFSRFGQNVFDHFLFGPCLAVGAVMGKRIVHIDDGEDAGFKRDGIPF